MMASVDICICTFRRPFLAETLHSLAALAIGDVDIRVIIADNDASPSAQDLVETMARDFRWPITYLHAPAANICIARNACLDAASADYVAFIDDDETVSPQWLGELLDTARLTRADAVLGPVRAVYDTRTPAWMVEGDFHSTLPVRVNGAIRTGYTCNVLIRRAAPFAALRFDLALGQSGGEDTDYFHRLTALGGTIAEAPGALVYEPVPAERAAMAWLIRRRLRMGQTHGMLLRGARLPAAAIAMAKASYCVAMAGATAFSPIGRRKNLLRAVLHMGVVGGIMGVRQAVHYGDGAARQAPHSP
ncbi:MAG: glycosyltransferase family 2 protein [Devosia sp.]|jgi:succinoglycan biosynthesis protein ExoM|uniref:glycosyltransferase family 2 protein n=1 Tax=Devosia sp. XGJD_8 TaxID=3391187 RepID=UPI003942A919